MNRVCLTKDGKLIEMQGGGDDRPDLMKMRLNTLKQNALNAGYKEDEIEVKWVTDGEYLVIQEASKPEPTEEQLYEAAIKVKAKEIMDAEYRAKAIIELEAEK